MASRLTVTAPAGIDRAAVDLTHHLSIELGVSDLVGACGVRPPDPNNKPTLQLFDSSGYAVGFAKVGWSDATRNSSPRRQQRSSWSIVRRSITRSSRVSP